MEAKFKLRTGPPLAPMVVPLRAGACVLLGRGSSCDVLLEDARLAEMHCQVVEQEGRYFLFDLHTVAGTYVNGVRILRQELQANDVVELGCTEMQFKLVEEGKTSRRERRRAPRDANVGRTLGDYVILEPIGRGAISVVYKARQISRDRILAFKVLSPRLSRDPASRERFLKGAANASVLRHPNIVQIYAAGQVGDIYYLTMEYVPGQSAKEAMGRGGAGGLPPARVYSVACQMTEALNYAFEQRIVHRDVKPSNILLDPGGCALLCDLELAKKIDDIDDEGDNRPAGYLGTLPYMPLEQVLDPETVDQRSDIYSLGASMYGMLTGKAPFWGDSRTEMVDRISAGDFKHPDELDREVPKAFWDIILRAMSVYPEDRYQTPAEVRDALHAVGSAQGWGVGGASPA